MDSKEDDEVLSPERLPSPPPHTSFQVRGVRPPDFTAFKPKEHRLTVSQTQSMTHVDWSCDGRRIAGVGIDKICRVWHPEKLDARGTTTFSNGHSDQIDYVSWNPTHPDLFCTSSQKERKIVFWDYRQSRSPHQCPLKFNPVETRYSPDGRTLMFATPGHQLHFLGLRSEEGSTKETWRAIEQTEQMVGSTALFNHAGDGIVAAHSNDHAIRIMDYPSKSVKHHFPAHVSGCTALALDPRGHYLASGGNDSIVNMFDLSDLICTRTITSVADPITALDFSYDGEFLAISSAGKYIDICATETGIPANRIPSTSSSPTVAWHPSSHCLAYCGHSSGPPAITFISLFGSL